MNIASVVPYSRVVCPDCGTENRVKKHFGPYMVTRRHAIGGMSSVFVAKDDTLDREVALKILSEEYSKDETRIAAFEQEARLTASFSHPHVVRVYTTGRAFGLFYIAMEFVPGGHFEHRIRELGKVPETKVIPLAIQIAEGLKGAQSAGLIHRDIKPGNILLDSEGSAKIVDFGLALVTKGGKAKATEIWATPFYVPPEAIEGGVEDFRADIYAFGATLYHALAGRPPCSEESMSTSLLKAAKMKVVPLKKAAPELTDEICAVIDRAMAYESNNRFQSYDEMIVELKTSLKAAHGELNRDFQGITKAERRAQLRDQKKRKMITTVGIITLCMAVVVSLILIRTSGLGKKKDSSSTVVAVGDGDGSGSENSQEVASRYHSARRAMTMGDYNKAEKVFSSLLMEQDVQEPTRTWAGLEAVVAAFMDGRTNDARRNAKLVERHIASNPPDLSAGFAVGVGPILRKLDDIPFFDPAEMNLDENGTERFMGFLIAGLKNWEQGGLEEAVPFFRKIVEDPSLKGNGVLSWYRETAGYYLSDYDLLTSGPLDTEPKDPKECRKTIDELNETLTLMKTRGRAKFNIRARQLDLARLEKDLKDPRKPLKDRAKEIWKEIDSLATNYRFSEIDNLIAKTRNELSEGLKNTLTVVNSAAGLFLPEIESDLLNKPVKIVLNLKDGAKINSLAMADEKKLLGRLDSGEVRELKWKDFHTDQLIELHREILQGVTDGQKRLRRHELAIAFEWLAGDRRRARSAAEKLSSENSDFKTRWEKAAKILPR